MLDVIVQRREQEAEDILSFDFVSSKNASLPAFTPGAHIDVHLPGGIVRQYSLCHPWSESSPGQYTIAVQREPQSRGGSVAAHALQTGMALQISEPRNLFELAPAAQKHLLFAGGIGITPIVCMAQALASQGQSFELHYFCRSQERAAFQRVLKSSALSQFAHLHVGTDTAAEVAQLLSTPEAGTHVYVCGPTGFMDCVLGTAANQGWNAQNLHKEYFAAAVVELQGDQSFQVQVASTGQHYEIPVGKTVFEILDSAGVNVPVSCEQGVCGTCVTRVLQGTPDHRDQYLTDAEKAANDCFTPCCSRSRTPLLVLDL